MGVFQNVTLFLFAEDSMNRNLMLAIVVIACAAVGFWLYGKSKRDAALPDLAPVGANLIEGLGDYSMPVTAKSPEVQRWFDQGLAMTYGLNHDAAERSFLKAAELDPDCAMCWWGSALVLGPHVNATMDPPTIQRRGIGCSARSAPRPAPPKRSRPSSRRSRHGTPRTRRIRAGRSTRPTPPPWASSPRSIPTISMPRRCTPRR
jgi:hypothetical protein